MELGIFLLELGCFVPRNDWNLEFGLGCHFFLSPHFLLMVFREVALSPLRTKALLTPAPPLKLRPTSRNDDRWVVLSSPHFLFFLRVLHCYYFGLWLLWRVSAFLWLRVMTPLSPRFLFVFREVALSPHRTKALPAPRNDELFLCPHHRCPSPRYHR